MQPKFLGGKKGAIHLRTIIIIRIKKQQNSEKNTKIEKKSPLPAVVSMPQAVAPVSMTSSVGGSFVQFCFGIALVREKACR